MTFRSVLLSRVCASIAFIACCGGVSVASLALGIAWPESPFLAVNFLLTFFLLAVSFLNLRPHYMPTIRYRGGKIVASLAVGLFLCAVLGRFALGGSPDIRIVDGQRLYCAVNHGKATPVNVTEYYWLVASLPTALTMVLLHCLLENRWRYNKETVPTENGTRGRK